MDLEEFTKNLKTIDLKKVTKNIIIEYCEKNNIEIKKSYTKQKIYDIITKKSEVEFMKPPIKWAGGKTQLLEKVFEHFPNIINNYYELFLGGGSVLIRLLDLINCKKIIVKGTINAFDINEVLIGMYKNIQTKPDELIKHLIELKTKYLSITNKNGDRDITNETDAIKSKESYFYWIRQKYNKMDMKTKSSPLGSATFIFINKTCFRGLHREGPNGFNVPFGNYENPDFAIETITKLSNLVKNVNFQVIDFKDGFTKIKKDDFVYLDPPYVPTDDKSFVKYNAQGFNEKEHLELFKLTKTTNFLMSNSNAKNVIDTFNGYKIYYIDAKRAINSKNPEATTTEVLIKN